jgi:hypothetical protein
METIKERIINFSTLYDAAKQCARRVQWKRNVITYMENVLLNTATLQRELEDGSYKPGKLIPLEVYEPKRRTVLSSRYKDRQVQRALISQYLYRELTRHFIYDNHAGQTGKGTTTARNRMKIMMEKAYRKWGKAYIHTFDISGFFPNTRHDVAKAAIRKRVKDDWAVSLINLFIDNFEGDVGIGLGAEIGQITELAVLDGLDHALKERLHARFYIRYMDDFAIIGPDKAYLRTCREVAEEKLGNIGLQLNPKKSRIFPLSTGFTWLGFTYRQTSTGKIIVTLPKKKIIRERRKLKRLVRAAKAGKISKKTVEESFNSWKGHAKYGNNHNTIRRMTQYYKNLWRKEK